MGLFFRRRKASSIAPAKQTKVSEETPKEKSVLDMKREYNYYNATNDIKLTYPEFVVMTFGWGELDRILANEYNELSRQGFDADVVMYDYETFCKKEYKLKVERLSNKSRKYTIKKPAFKPDSEAIMGTISYE